MCVYCRVIFVTVRDHGSPFRDLDNDGLTVCDTLIVAGETNIAAVRVDLLKNRENRSSQVASIMRVLTLGDIFSWNNLAMFGTYLSYSVCYEELFVLSPDLAQDFGYGMHEVHVKY